MKPLKSILAVGLLAMTDTATAQSNAPAPPKGTILTFMRGACSELVVAGTDMTPECTPTLLSAAYPTGNSSFMFTISGKAMVSFFGRDNPAVHGRGMLYLQRVSFKDSSPNSPSSDVIGTCTYTLSVIDCEADSKDGQFKAVFTTDGQAPTVIRN